MRKLGKPPHLIMRIMDCVLILMRRKLNPIEMDPERPCPKPSWTEALKLMNQSQFLSMLLNFSKVCNVTMFYLLESFDYVVMFGRYFHQVDIFGFWFLLIVCSNSDVTSLLSKPEEKIITDMRMRYDWYVVIGFKRLVKWGESWVMYCI